MRQLNAETILNHLRSIKPVLQKKGIESLALFGSYAVGKVGVYSDIDVAIQKSPQYLNHYTAYDYFATLNELRENLRRTFHRNVDIVDLDSDSPFLERIRQEMIRA